MIAILYWLQENWEDVVNAVYVIPFIFCVRAKTYC